jgi:uncharacterized protein with GYD domain
MSTYVTLASFTEQGLRNIKDTVKRSEMVRKAAADASDKARAEARLVQEQRQAEELARNPGPATGRSA